MQGRENLVLTGGWGPVTRFGMWRWLAWPVWCW